ncbi:MAG: hypothetical protein EOP04_12585 [Proteobacteria bacterium]|nr:MAG: hypothetical protein EOP04_12585 [Pseudomonadota bacterium]
MFHRFSFGSIVRDHFKTLYNYRVNSRNPAPNKVEIWSFFVVPIVFATLLWFYDIRLSATLQPSVLTGLTLLAGLLLNLLAIAQSMVGSFTNFPRARIAYRALHDTVANISYGIFTSLFAILFIVLLGMVGDNAFARIYHWCFNLFLGHLSLTLLIILGNMHLLTMRQIEDRIGGDPPANPNSPDSQT